MFRNLPRYDDMRVAGDWLDRIPQHWDWDPARTLFAERKQTGFDREPLLSVTIGRGVLPQADLMATTSKKDSSNTDKSKYKLVVPGDLVYNKMRAWQGAAGLSQHRGIVSPAYVVMTPRRGQAPYFHYIVRTPMFAKEAERWSYGITSDQWSLRPEHFKMIRFPVPPADEQAAIVKYLAHANARIDKAIAAKRRLIALLDERIQVQLDSVIAEAAGARVPFKSVVRLKEGPGIMAADFRDSGVPLIRIAGMHGSEVDLSGCNHLDPDMVADRWEHFRLEPGDYLLSASGSTGAVKPVGASAVGAVPYTGLIRLRPATDAVDMRFMALFVGSRHFAAQIETMKTGVGIEHFGPTHLKRMWVQLPSLAIQSESVARFERERESASVTRGNAEREIELLHEFRSRLVADVVTGQLDVREVAARLPKLDAGVAAAEWAEDVSELMIGDVREMSEV